MALLLLPVTIKQLKLCFYELSFLCEDSVKHSISLTLHAPPTNALQPTGRQSPNPGQSHLLRGSGLL